MTPSIIQSGEPHCFITGSTYNLDHHHAMPGTANRKLADKYGLWVWLRHDVHMRLHDQDKALDKEIRQAAQRAFEAKYDHEAWMKIFRKNYL